MLLAAPELKSLDWTAEDDLLFQALFPLIQAAAMDGAGAALVDLLARGIGVDWGLVNIEATEWARKYTYDLVKGINDTTRRFLQSEIAEWIASGVPLDSLIEGLAPMFGDVRAEMIAVTEITSAFANGNDAAWLQSGVVEEFDIETSEDDLVCPICNDKKDNSPWRIGDPEGQPSFHVACRCWKRPVVKL